MVECTADKNSVLVTVTVHKRRWAVLTYRINVTALYLCRTEQFCFPEYKAVITKWQWTVRRL